MGQKTGCPSFLTLPSILHGKADKTKLSCHPKGEHPNHVCPSSCPVATWCDLSMLVEVWTIDLGLAA
jgi:hypothetical protein